MGKKARAGANGKRKMPGVRAAWAKQRQNRKFLAAKRRKKHKREAQAIPSFLCFLRLFAAKLCSCHPELEAVLITRP